jgi:hypothetical protein
MKTGVSHTSTIASAASDPKDRRRIVNSFLRPERPFDARLEFIFFPLLRYEDSTGERVRAPAHDTRDVESHRDAALAGR